jgi:putative oxidoreductase
MQKEAGAEPSLLFPGLQGFYRQVIPLSWLIVRFGVGWNLAIHGYGKILRGMAGQAAVLDKSVPYLHSVNLPLSYLLTFVEGIGGLCIMLGLFTRFFAAANAIEMGFLTFVLYWGRGFPGSREATSTRCCGASCAWLSPSEAAVLIRSIERSGKNCKPEQTASAAAKASLWSCVTGLVQKRHQDQSHLRET